MNIQRDPDLDPRRMAPRGPDPAPRYDAAGDRGNHPNHPSIAAPEMDAVEGSDLEWIDPNRPRGRGRRGRCRRGTLSPQTWDRSAGRCRRPGVARAIGVAHAVSITFAHTFASPEP